MPNSLRALDLLEQVRGHDPRLGRDAPPVEARSAQLVLLDDGGLETQLRGTDRGDVAAGSGADDDEVERLRRGHGGSALFSVVGCGGLGPTTLGSRAKGCQPMRPAPRDSTSRTTRHEASAHLLRGAHPRSRMSTRPSMRSLALFARPPVPGRGRRGSPLIARARCVRWLYAAMLADAARGWWRCARRSARRLLGGPTPDRASVPREVGTPRRAPPARCGSERASRARSAS